MDEPLRLSFEVDCPAQHAFDVWTRRMSTWWPVSHTVSGETGLEIVLEGRQGGRIFERTASGSEFDWGRVTSWDPPRRLSYVWHLRQEPENATEVDIAFCPAGPVRTRVEIEHRGWERLGASGQVLRERNTAGWNGVLPHFLAAATAP
ncbi:MAG: SRPBCC domain-containing protein [Chloroflexi bacterium]|nr:SRPBCC domain-containing protein [Chloroflexota bacterium]